MLVDPSPPLALIECSRDAMQGWSKFIPTERKINYLNSLLRVGFDTVDFGSFVSPKAVPQMSDTASVLGSIDWSGLSSTKLLAIVANEAGAGRALDFEEIAVLGYPFSVSEVFQQRNARSSIAESFLRLLRIQEMCVAQRRTLVVYLSMAFGNPYGEDYSPELVTGWARKICSEGVTVISLADTVGNAAPGQVLSLYEEVKASISGAVLGLHLHALPESSQEMVDAVLQTGCARIDSSIRGIGGCPFAAHELTGNLPTEKVIEALQDHARLPQLSLKAFSQALELSKGVFS